MMLACWCHIILGIQYQMAIEFTPVTQAGRSAKTSREGNQFRGNTGFERPPTLSAGSPFSLLQSILAPLAAGLSGPGGRNISFPGPPDRLLLCQNHD